ncbi:centrosome and spindle pole-associated protein 1 isoform X1 [Silurus asotus]|uniref:Centrosome and spindle pole-associated protein 1 isoform X1 n=1 Tax=Silurus asotus TaxID=30991 RepID=A0AAD5FIK2_SILAS|nr:centrosome and spindle pole-associated protein 1 isoform X1 [Silurus asotus]
METARNQEFVEEKSKIVTGNGDLPYMEMKSSFGRKAVETAEPPGKPASQTKPHKDEAYGLSLQLGEEYERKKQKLKEELRLDFMRYMSQDKTLDEWIQDQSPLLRGDEEMQKMRKTPNPSQPRGKDHFISSYRPSFSPKSRGRRSPETVHHSKRDNQIKPVLTPTRRGSEDTARRWHRRSRRERYSTEEEQSSAEEEQEELLRKGRSKRQTDPQASGRRHRNRQHRADRFVLERREAEVPAVNEDDHREEQRRTPLAQIKANPFPPAQTRAANKKNMTDFATGLLIGVAEEEGDVQRRKERYKQELLEQMAEQRRNKKKEKDLELRVAATGAIDPEKEVFRHYGVCEDFVLPQGGEGNEVANPDRIKQFGAVRREHEGRRRDLAYKAGTGLGNFGPNMDKRTHEVESAPPERPRVAFQSPTLAFSENFHKDLSGTIGEIVAPRVARVPPPPAPSLSEVYSTPYDEAYYYYGARNPLDPNLTHYGPSAVQQSPNLPARALASVTQPPTGVFPQQTSQHGVTPRIGIGAYPSERHPHPKDHDLSYKDALKQQIEEKQERRRREREEKERYESKLEAEMKAYEPWGRGGAGAPLRDDQGNLISDLKRMHRTNEEAYVNPELRSRRAVASVDEATSRAEDKVPSLHRVLDDKVSSFTQPSPYARGNVFSELPTALQVREKERYKESLKQQIEEKQRMEAERRQRLRLEEEQEEKRLAEERAQMQRQFEEEQEKEKRKEMEKNTRNQEIIRQAEERRREAEKKKKQEEEKANEPPKTQYKQDFRSESPPIPALQRRLGKQIPPRPPSIDSQRSTTDVSVRSNPTPQSPPVPAQRNQIRAAEEQKGVIRELSVLRRHLRSEQKRLEGQLLHSDREETPTPLKNRQPQLNAFDMVRLKMQMPKERPPSNRPLKSQIIQDFNKLKYRDGESREKVRRAYPEPPTDQASLEIQQQALLREQQRRLDNMQRAGAVDYFDLSSPMKSAPRRRESRVDETERNMLLESESAFIDANGYSFPITPPSDRISARERRRRARRNEFFDGLESPSGERNSYSVGSANSFLLDRVQELNQRRMRVLDDMSEKDQRLGEIPADEEDDFWQQTPSPPPARRASTATVATESWLRPGTTETLKKLMAGRRPSSRNLPRDTWDAPSTYYG